MDLSSFNSSPYFYGKDNPVSFLGQVEDVNDPKRSGRVKVRILGWHPFAKEGEEGLSTEDLPWARVGMPVTFAQQNRVGGKHALMVGSWVYGVFLDGFDANDPLVQGTYNHTAKASEENNRTDIEAEDGTAPSDVDGYEKVNPNAPNAGTNTKEEIQSGTDDAGDVAHDVTLDDSNDGECPINESAFSTTKKEPKTPTNPHSQVFNTGVADGLCGSLQNGRGLINDAIASMLPNADARVVSEAQGLFDINGNQLNLNGMMNKLSSVISSLLKDTIQTEKARIQKMINKKVHSSSVGQAASRSPLTAQLMDQVMSTQYDMFNQLIDSSLELLQDQVMGSLMNINNQKENSKIDSNSSGESGSKAATSLLDVEPIYITDSILNDVGILFEQKVDKSQKESEEYCKPLLDKVGALSDKIADTIPEDYECLADMEDDIKKDVEELEEEIKQSSNQGGGMDLAAMLSMVLDQDFTTLPNIFNKSGPGVMDMFTSQGCNPSDMYNTVEGFVGSIGGVGGGASGGGSESGKSSKEYQLVAEIGFGGKNGPPNKDETTFRPFPEELLSSNPKPSGRNASVLPASVPSSDEEEGVNYKKGIPNTPIIKNPGKDYYFRVKENNKYFPSIFILNYQGTPVPVVDKKSGELVAIQTNAKSWGKNPFPSVSVIPDNSTIGITTDDKRYDVYLDQVYVKNTGIKYESGDTISVIDRDTEQENGSVEPVVEGGRIVGVRVINSGSRFKRIPKLVIHTKTGKSAKLYPVMKLKDR